MISPDNLNRGVATDNALSIAMNELKSFASVMAADVKAVS